MTNVGKGQKATAAASLDLWERQYIVHTRKEARAWKKAASKAGRRLNHALRDEAVREARE